MRHYALIPAKEISPRCPNKNWRPFFHGLNLVDYTLRVIPRKIFSKIIISTDKRDYIPKFTSRCLIHKRDKGLAQPNSDINELIKIIIYQYKLQDEDYLWLLNPTSPLRLKKDFLTIAEIIAKKKPKTIISVTGISPYIWKNNTPLFKIKRKRKNTQDLPNLSFENGMFYVFRIKDYKKHGVWYNNDTFLFEIKEINGSIDIDHEQDFINAQKIAGLMNS